MAWAVTSRFSTSKLKLWVWLPQQSYPMVDAQKRTPRQIQHQRKRTPSKRSPVKAFVIPPETITTSLTLAVFKNELSRGVYDHHTKSWLVVDEIPVHQSNIATVQAVS